MREDDCHAHDAATDMFTILNYTMINILTII